MKAIFLWADGTEVKSGGTTILLGPSGTAQVVIPGTQGASAWARISLDQRHYFLTPLECTEPMTVNGRPVTERQEILGGDEIGFGSIVCRFGFEVEPSDLFASQAGPHVSPDSAVRRMRTGLENTMVKKAQVKEESKKTTTRLLLLGVSMGILIAGIVYGGLRLLSRSEQRSKERAIELEQKMMSRIESASDALRTMQTRHEESVKAFRSYQDAVRDEIGKLETRSKELLAESREKNARELEEIDKRLKGLKVDVGENAPVEKTFRELHGRVESGILLIACVTVVRVPGSGEQGDLRFGTGFLVDESGTVVTCKHVAQPWKYRELAEEIAQVEGRVVRSSLYAWRAGEDFLDDEGKIREDTAFSTANEKLKLLKTTKDNLSDVLLPQETGKNLLVRMETELENDVALLRVQAYGATPLRMAGESELKALTKLDPVMVSGFPLGTELFEGRKVETSPSIGTVRKYEVTIQISAPVSPGNSGGPVFDLEGRVIGIASYKVGAAEAVNGCVPITQVRQLME